MAQNHPPIDARVRIGHVHLKVADLERALTFYRDVLGFELTQQLGRQAAFLSAGGYHHHIGMNTWESFGAGARGESLGLSSFEFILSDKKEVEELKRHLKRHTIPFTQNGDKFTFEDPWKNRITIALHSAI